jgi:TRAP-type C4-dicarboxylate transport system substrate-binding protein
LAIVLGACGGSAAKVGGSEKAEPVVLTFASNNGGLPSQVGAYLDEVEQRAGGTLQIEYVGDWRQGEPDQEIGLIRDVQAGKVEMAWVGARAFDSLGVTSFQALVAPFLVDSYELQDRVFAAGIPARMLEGLAPMDLTGIGVLPGPMRQMAGVDHPFTRPADFDRAVVGTSGGDLALQTLRSLGATPRVVPAETSLDGLDGLDYQLAAIYGNRYYEAATHVTGNLNLWPRPLVIVIDSARFAELSDEQQAILRDAAEAAIAPASEATRAEEAEGGSGLCSVGITVVDASDADRAALLEAVAPVYAELEEDSVTRSFLEEIRTVKAQTAAPAESLVCPAGAGGSVAAPTPIDGVWRVTTTADELLAAGDPESMAENYGSWAYVFAGGRFAFTQESEDACTWAYGTYTVDGDRVEWEFIDGGGIAPNNAANKPGEFFVFEWSRYHDTLTLAAAPGEVSPTNFMVEPWRLTDEPPSPGAFGSRCPPPAEAIEGVTGEAVPATSIDGT